MHQIKTNTRSSPQWVLADHVSFPVIPIFIFILFFRNWPRKEGGWVATQRTKTHHKTYLRKFS